MPGGQIVDFHDEDFHTYTVVSAEGVQICRFEVDQVYSKDGAVWGEVAVFYLFDRPDNPTRIIAHKRVNMLTDKKPGIDDLAEYSNVWPWDEFYEQVLQRTVDAHRTPVPDHLMDHEKPEEPKASFLVNPFVLNEGVSLLYGPGGTGKSLLALATALSVASGRILLGRRPTRTGPVLYVDYEDTLSVHEARLRALREGNGIAADEVSHGIYHLKPVRSVVKMRRDLKVYVRERSPALIVIDSVGLGRGGDANGSEETIRFFATLNGLGVPVLAVDHMTKDDTRSGKMLTPYGSVYTVNSVRLAWAVKAAKSSSGDLQYLNLTQTKRNNVAAHQPMGAGVQFTNVQRGFGDGGDIFEPVLTGVKVTMKNQHWEDIEAVAKDRIVEWLEVHGPHTMQEIADGVEISYSSVRARVADLVKAKTLVHTSGTHPKSFGASGGGV